MRSNIIIKIMLIMGLLIMISTPISAAAIYFPLPINGVVQGNYVDGLNIQVTNERTGIVMNTKTTGSGEFLVDWANSDDKGDTITKYQRGDVFKIELTDCAEAYCIQAKIYEGQPEIFTTFTIYDSCVCQTCQEEDSNILANILIGLVIALVATIGGGIKIYRNRLGKAVLQHKHRGIRGYHDPNTSHKNPVYKHRRWKDDPLGCLKDVKKIEDTGGL